MFNFLKNFFSFSPKFGMGSLPIPADSRNISIAQVQAPTVIPEVYMTDIAILGVENQGAKPICVGESIAKIAEYYLYKNTGKVVKFDAEKLYNQCKIEDGVPDQAGTYPSVAAKIVIRDGIDIVGLDSNNKISTGYVFVPADFEAVCQAIYQNGMVTIGIFIDSNWFSGIIGKALKSIGGHQTDLHGYDKPLGRVYGINSWGIEWIGHIAGLIDSKVMPGFYVAKFEDIKENVMSIIALVPIAKGTLDEVKNTPYKFITTMRFGSRGPEVVQLQKFLNVSLKDGIFGNDTLIKVKTWQIINGLSPDGIIGPLARAKMNVGTKSFIPQWIETIKQMEGAKPSRNNPGNLRFIGQQYAINDGGFCKFDTYEHGYNALEKILINACSGKSKNYHPDENIEEFYAGVPFPNRFGRDIGGYAPENDGNNPKQYAKFVATKLGVPVTTRIADLM